MSRLGKLPIKLEPGVKVSVNNNQAYFQGPKGQFSFKLHPYIELKIENEEIKVVPRNKDQSGVSAFWGLMWSLTRNAVIGVTSGFSKQLEINGVGYRAVVNGRTINLNLGYSHPIAFDLPEGITASVAGNIITLEGIDKALVGETAAQIRKLRKPEPYKGKGVKYVDEVIRRKAGKAVSKGVK